MLKSENHFLIWEKGSNSDKISQKVYKQNHTTRLFPKQMHIQCNKNKPMQLKSTYYFASKKGNNCQNTS